MTVRLGDVIVPEVFNRYLTRDTMTKSAIFESGVLRSDPTLSAFLSGGGLTVTVPFWSDLEDDEPGIASDDPEQEATPGGIGTTREVAIRNVSTKGWAAAKLTAELAGSNPMTRILERVTKYWTRAYQRHLVAILTGIFADNAANDSSDMINDIGNDAGTAILAAEKVSAEAIVDTQITMGDSLDSLELIIMHSLVYGELQKQNLIDFIPNSEGKIKFPTYLGYRVMVDDGVNTVAGSNRVKYWTYLLGAGSIAWGESPVATPVETDRKPSRGNGMGVDELWTRRQYIMHPYGFRWLDASRAQEFPSNAEAELAGNWDRVATERKQVRIAALVTNG
jgi:hypothetical protein